jgi:uncharacterized protein (TIGR02266 family)
MRARSQPIREEPVPRKKVDRRQASATRAVERRASADDRRTEGRAVIDVAVDFETDGLYLYAYLTDLSARGVFIMTNEPYPRGTRLKLRFELPGEEKTPIVVDGDVRWIRDPRSATPQNPSGMGVQFDGLGASSLAKLSTFIKSTVYVDESGVKQRDAAH